MFLGTADVGVRHSRSFHSERLVAALEAGFTGFDTAPLYGDGLAETLLRPVLRRRPEVRVQTKVGLARRWPTRSWPRPVALVAAAGLSRMGSSYERTLAITRPDELESQHQASLSRLGRDHVDVLLLHDPVADATGDGVVEWLVTVRQSGRAAAVGLAGPWEQCRALLRRHPATFDVVQVPASDLPTLVSDLGTAENPPAVRVHGLVAWQRSLGSGGGDVAIEARARVADLVTGTAIEVEPLVATTSLSHMAAWGRSAS